MKVKFHFKDVDHLIAKIKSATVERKTRQAKFATKRCPPQPVVTRYESWLNASFFMQKIYRKRLWKVLKGLEYLVTQAKLV